MTQVIKRGGRRQNFMPSKIKNSIRGAAKEAGFSRQKVEDLVNDVGNSVIDIFRKKRVVKAVAVRKSILGRLERRTKAVANAWRRFEKRKAGKF